MGGLFLNPTFANGGLDWQFPASELGGSMDDTCLCSDRWNYHRRGSQWTYFKNKWRSLWPGPSFLSGSPSSPMTMFGEDSAFGGASLAFDLPTFGEGTQSTKFLKGTCKDSVDAVVANATLEAFRTVDNVMVGQATSFADGTYIISTDNPVSAQHYIVAYKAGSPDISGTTVNTLTPTNIDGT